MPQLHLCVPEDVARQLRERARAAGMSVSRYLAAIIRVEVNQNWPEGFFEDVVGGWQGKPLRRPVQSKREERESL